MADHGPLHGLRVLELSDEKAQWAGKLMADFGADVIKIEPPGGESTRTVGPFYQDVPNRERSLYFWHYNTSKRGITLDLDSVRTGAACSAGWPRARTLSWRRSSPATCHRWAWVTTT